MKKQKRTNASKWKSIKWCTAKVATQADIISETYGTIQTRKSNMGIRAKWLASQRTLQVVSYRP